MLDFTRRNPVIVAAEDVLTPLEVRDRIAAGDPGSAEFMLFRELKRRAPKRFRARVLADGATHYSAALGAKRLVVVLADRQARPLAPISVFLQALDDRAFDVLLLVDRRKLHFASGAGDFAGSFAELAGKVAALSREGRYASVVTFGGSLGALPALRLGRLIGADRAVSVGGRFAYHVGRLLDPANPGVEAFDPLCACVSADAPCYHVYSERDPQDLTNANVLAAMRPDVATLPVPTRKHNVVYTYFQNDRLDRFLGSLFDLSRTPSRSDLIAILNDGRIKRQRRERLAGPSGSAALAARVDHWRERASGALRRLVGSRPEA